MNDKLKKAISAVLSVACLTSVFAFSGCGDTYTGEKLDGYVSSAAAGKDNGGFAVEKGDYVYFINGMEEYTASNTYGDVVKGALMRISKTDLAAGDYSDVDTVVPMLFVAQNFDSGIYIYGDYVYYATPTTDKNMHGEVESSWIDFKRAKLDGTETMKDYYFRLSSNEAKYRFVEENGVVYCMYQEDTFLKSYDTKERTSRVLAETETFYWDENDQTNPNVYYTMPVELNADTEHATTVEYNQLYKVNAAARVESVGEKDGVASYKVKGGATYTFDAAYLKEQSDKAVENKMDPTYVADDYSTYPYVNLGTLVLDGIGANALTQSQFNTNGNKADSLTPDGYSYGVTAYKNGGVYFTRTEVTKTSSDAENVKLYYLADADIANDWNAVKANSGETFDVVAKDSKLVDSAVLTVDADGVHEYYRVVDNVLYKNTVAADGTATDFAMAKVGEVTLWTMEGEYLYYYAASENGNGNSLSRINVDGDEDNYNPLLVTEEYKPATLAGVEWNSSWYKPEIYGDKVLYCNEQSFGDVAYSYIYAAKLGATQADINALNEKYEAVQDEIDKYTDDVQDVAEYYFRTGKTTAYDAVKSLYDEKTEQKDVQAFIDKFSASENKLEKESYFFAMVGEVKADDQQAMDDAWAAVLRHEKNSTEEEGLPGWAIALIIVGSVLVVAAAVLIPLLIVLSKKKAKAKAAEETVNAYKRKKIDTTDDKSIDVYADENAENTQENAETEEDTAAVETAQETPVEEEKTEE